MLSHTDIAQSCGCAAGPCISQCVLTPEASALLSSSVAGNKPADPEPTTFCLLPTLRKEIDFNEQWTSQTTTGTFEVKSVSLSLPQVQHTSFHYKRLCLSPSWCHTELPRLSGGKIQRQPSASARKLMRQ